MTGLVAGGVVLVTGANGGLGTEISTRSKAGLAGPVTALYPQLARADS